MGREAVFDIALMISVILVFPPSIRGGDQLFYRHM